MMNALTIQLEALDGFRRLYGVNARPEDMPREWTAVVAEVRDCLNEMVDDCSARMDEDAPYWAQEDR
jgi:hypothetical protein